MKPKLKVEPEFKDVMVDLETLGVTPGCIILSIGAVAFDPKTNQLGPEFYVIVSTTSCRAHNLKIDQSTLDWWEEQSEDAKEVLIHAEEGGLSLVEAMSAFTNYLSKFGLNQVRIWGNGADFDNTILSCCYSAIEQKVPWSPWNGRCYRTLKNIIKGPKLKRQGTHHNALDDAKTQAEHAMSLLK